MNKEYHSPDNRIDEIQSRHDPPSCNHVSSTFDTKGALACVLHKENNQNTRVRRLQGVDQGIASSLVLSLVSGSIFVTSVNLMQHRLRSNLELV